MEGDPAPTRAGGADGKLRWYQSPLGLAACFFLLGPLMLPLVWRHPHYTPAKKLLISVVVLGVTVWTLSSLVDLYVEQLSRIANL